MFGAVRIAVWRHGVVVRIVPIGAPFVDIVADVVEAECVGGVAGYGLGAGLPARGVIGQKLWWIVAPGELFLFEAAAGGAFPFGFGGKAIGASSLRREPLAILNGLKPVDRNDRMLRLVEVGVWRDGRTGGIGCALKEFVFRVGNLSRRDREGINPDAVDGTFAVLAGIGAH